MIRALVFLVLVTGLALAALWLVDNPGQVQIAWWDWRVETSVGILALAVALMAVAAALLYRFWRFLIGAPDAIADAGRERRRSRGYRALGQGMAALVAGDAAEAARLARRADNLLDDPGLTLPLKAQAARLAGDAAAAKRAYEALAANEETAFLGVSGLLTLARQAGDTDEALRLAGEARALRANAPWVLDNLFQLQVAARLWGQALETLDRAARRKALAADVARRHRAALMLERSAERERAGDASGALADARKAADLVPALAPAAAAAVRLMAAAGKERQAAKLAQRIWAAHPHPRLAEAYLAIWQEAPQEVRYRHAEALGAANPEHPESRLAMAEAALAAELWEPARGHLEKALAASPAPGARTCRLMAELERLQNGNLAAAQYWLEQAGVAPPAPAWVCAECGATADEWTSICGHCGAFDGVAWRLPPRLMPAAAPSAPEPGPRRAEVDTIPPLPPPDVTHLEPAAEPQVDRDTAAPPAPSAGHDRQTAT